MPDSMQLLTFDNLAQRVLYRYAFAFADFVPIESDMVPVDAQRAFYRFCESVVRGVAEDPSLLGMSTEQADEWLEAHGVMNRRPVLSKVRNEGQKAFCDLCGLLFAVGASGDYRDGRLVVRRSELPKLTGKTLAIYQKLFERYGLLTEISDDILSFTFSDCPEALAAWKLLAAKCGENQERRKELPVRFALWIHDGDGSYFLKRIETLLGLDKGFFAYVAEKYRAKGYNAQFIVDEYNVNYVYSKDVGGLSIQYSTLLPTVRFVNRTCIGIKAALEHANQLDDEVIGQLVRFCKPCSGCMLCTKSGKNKPFTVTVHHGGNEYRLCPEFVQMEWYNNDISREKSTSCWNSTN